MSISSALYVGVSGLSAESDALGVIGDNLANTSTIGFKESRANFDDVLGSAVGGDQTIGSGVRLANTQQIFAEGSMQSTGVNTDMAISGDGFFVVGGSVSGTAGTYYTRNGESSLNSQGQLVNPDGLQFQGYAANGDGTFSTTLSPITVSNAALPPKMTTTLNVTANLDSTATAPTGAFDAQNPSTTSNFSTSMQVYDSKGTAHSVNVYFDKNANGSWDYHALASGSDVAGGTAGQNVDIASGTLTFTSTGALQSNTVNAGGTVSFNGASANQPLTLNFGTSIAAGGTGVNGITDYAGTSTVSAQSQDGYASGSLSGVTIGSDGTVEGVYTNGQSIGVAQLAVAKFQSNEGLARNGSNLWTATSSSGVAAVGTAGAGGRGSLVTGELEASNVDVSTQMVDLIAHQFSFQADSKTITTADQMLQDVIQMKQ
jgi:flagellar hook protein FlgE